MTNFGINSPEGQERIVGVAVSPGAAASTVLTADGAGGTSWAAGGGSQPTWEEVTPADATLYDAAYWTESGSSGATLVYDPVTKTISRTDDTATQAQLYGATDFLGASWAFEFDARINDYDADGNMAASVCSEVDTTFAADTGPFVTGTTGAITIIPIGGGGPSTPIPVTWPDAVYNNVRYTTSPWATYLWVNGVLVLASGPANLRDLNDLESRFGIVLDGVIDLRNLRLWRVPVEPWS